MVFFLLFECLESRFVVISDKGACFSLENINCCEKIYKLLFLLSRYNVSKYNVI